MNSYALLLQMRKTLLNMSGWLEKATIHAQNKNFDTAVLIQSRLAPDMFPFVRQVQSSCDTAKFAAARLSGREAPAHPDDELSIADLTARIAKVVAYLDTFSEADFAGAGTRTLSLPRWEGKSMSAEDYLVQHAIPNFYFHASMTYAILRHCGVDLGKRDFLGQLNFH